MVLDSSQMMIAGTIISPILLLAILTVLMLCTSCVKKRTRSIIEPRATQVHPEVVESCSLVSSDMLERKSAGSDISDDPERDFAMMRASVKAKQASQISIGGISGNRMLRSRTESNIMLKSTESMPKMGVPPKKITAGFTPMVPSSDVYQKKIQNKSDEENLLPKPWLTKTVSAISVDDQLKVKCAAKTPTSVRNQSRHTFGPAPENTAERIFGISKAESTTMFMNSSKMDIGSQESKNLPLVSETRRKRKRKYYT